LRYAELRSNLRDVTASVSIDPKELRRVIDLRGISMTQLAERSGLSLAYVCDVRDGRRTMARSPRQRQKLADALGVPRYWIERRTEVAA
jgi:transcriptional regulator with XRE-family HTH domain